MSQVRGVATLLGLFIISAISSLPIIKSCKYCSNAFQKDLELIQTGFEPVQQGNALNHNVEPFPRKPVKYGEVRHWRGGQHTVVSGRGQSLHLFHPCVLVTAEFLVEGLVLPHHLA